MGDSSCLLQDYSHAREASNQDREVKLASALGGSISFGRYLSESLDWGKWSSFSHNRYLEEVEKYSKPGSVAQKKAYFEAHYKNMAARKLASVLEHDSTITTTIAAERQANDGFSNGDSRIVSSDPEVESEEVSNTMNESQDVVAMAADSSSSSSGGENHVSGEKAGPIVEDEFLKGSSSQIESLDIIEDVENKNKIFVIEPDTRSPSEKQLLKESFVTNKDSVESVGKKSRGPVSKSSVSRSSKPPPSPATKPPFSPATTTTSFHRIKENNSTPSSIKKRGISSIEKKKPTQKSLHMSINITQYQSGATTTSESRSLSIFEKVENSKAASVVPKSSQECSHHFRTPIKASSKGVTKLVSLTPQSEHGRSKTPAEKSSSKKKIADLKLQKLSLDYSKSSSIKGHRQCSPLGASFSFKTHQSAEKRKEERAESESTKLRQSLCFKARPLPDFYRNIEPPKLEIRREKAENELRKTNQSLCFKARPLPDFYHNTRPTKFDMNKIQLIQHQSPKHRRTSNLKTDSELNNVPPLKPSFRSSRLIGITEKNDYSETPTNL